MKVKVNTRSITIKGDFRPYTCYTMRVGHVTDSYGQELENVLNVDFLGVTTFPRYLNPLGVVRASHFNVAVHAILLAKREPPPAPLFLLTVHSAQL